MINAYLHKQPQTTVMLSTSSSVGQKDIKLMLKHEEFYCYSTQYVCVHCHGLKTNAHWIIGVSFTICCSPLIVFVLIRISMPRAHTYTYTNSLFVFRLSSAWHMSKSIIFHVAFDEQLKSPMMIIPQIIFLRCIFDAQVNCFFGSGFCLKLPNVCLCLYT